MTIGSSGNVEWHDIVDEKWVAASQIKFFDIGFAIRPICMIHAT